MQRQGAMVHMSDTQFNRVLRAMRSACGVFMACEVYTSFSVTNLVVYTQTLRLWNAKRFINFFGLVFVFFLHHISTSLSCAWCDPWSR